MTLSDRLAATFGRPAGFDYLRIGLASMIVVWHTFITSCGVDYQRALVHGISRPIWTLILPMFFALSGFLVSGSLERCRTLISFLGLRVIRLLPALMVESLIAMLVIGPIFTSLTIGSYFTNPEFFSYLFNLIGDVHFYLPGVFTNNPTHEVNGQLWTLPWELKCYIAISAIAILGGGRLKWLLVAACGLIQAVVTYRTMLVHIAPGDDGGIVSGTVLVLSFLYGGLIYQFRDRIGWSRAIFLSAAPVSVFLMYFYGFNTLAALPIAYCTVYIGLTNPRRNAVVSSGDYSYGIFLYGFPIQQAVSAVSPSLREWWINLLIAGPITLGVAFASWHLIEKKALVLREALKRLEGWCAPHTDWTTRARHGESGLR